VKSGVKSKSVKAISNFKKYELGLDPGIIKMVDVIDDLRKFPHHIVIAESITNFHFKTDFYDKPNEFVKRGKYIMSSGMYQQLHANIYNPKVKILKPSEVKFKNVYRPYRGQDLTNKTLLVWRQGGIGDLLFISPNLRYLKDRYPSCKILFASAPQYQSMLRSWPFIDSVLDLPFSMSKLSSADYHTIFEGVIERTYEAQTVNAYNLFSKWMGLDLPDELLIPHQEPIEDNLLKCKKILSDWGIDEKSFILIQMRASSPIRTPRQILWKRLIDKLLEDGYPIVFTDSKKMAKSVNTFISTSKYKESKVFNFSEHSDEVIDSIALASMAKLVIGPDSSLIHIAESVGTKSFGIFGPFSGDVRLSTYKNCDWIDAKCHCAPCWQHGSSLCKYQIGGYVTCYDKINHDELYERIKIHLEK
jgi:ADP-heptose:LPS heptosyltransferase